MQKKGPRGGYTLKDSPFYQLSSRSRLAELLRVSEDVLAEISTVPHADLYKRRWKHKKLEKWLNEEPAGEAAALYRPIDIPAPRLKAMQSRIAELLRRIAPPDYLFSPVKGRSYVDNAAVHVGATAFWLLDISDYFPSCSANNVARLFRQDLKCSPDVTAVLVALSTHNGCLPQGSPCSPILAYFSSKPMWEEIVQVVKEAGCKVSVYADDITISGRIVRKAMIWKIKQIIKKHGMHVKASKELSLIHSAADITGVIVRGNRTLAPNRQLKRLAELRSIRAKTKSRKERDEIDQKIKGRLAQRQQIEQR